VRNDCGDQFHQESKIVAVKNLNTNAYVALRNACFSGATERKIFETFGNMKNLKSMWHSSMQNCGKNRRPRSYKVN
jgi:hypothetical protein